MNRAFSIILMPPLLVAAGYIVVLRYLGFSPAYWRLIIAIAVCLVAIFWLSRRNRSKTGTDQPR